MVFGQLQAYPRLVQFAAYFARINGPNEDSGGVGGVGSLNIPRS